MSRPRICRCSFQQEIILFLMEGDSSMGVRCTGTGSCAGEIFSHSSNTRPEKCIPVKPICFVRDLLGQSDAGPSVQPQPLTVRSPVGQHASHVVENGCAFSLVGQRPRQVKKTTDAAHDYFSISFLAHPLTPYAFPRSCRYCNSTRSPCFPDYTNQNFVDVHHPRRIITQTFYLYFVFSMFFRSHLT